MLAVARRSRAHDPVLHLVLGYDSIRGETPSRDEVQRHIERLLRARGYTARRGGLNQFVAFAHGDTDNLHVHVVANRVSSDGITSKDSHSRMRKEWLAAEIAAGHGWEIVAGKFNKGS